MKKILLLIGILLAGNILLAQDRQQVRERVDLKLEEYKERLELTDDQVAKWKEMREKYKPELKSIRDDQSKGKSDKMRAAADVLDKQEAELATILSEKQLAELKVIRSEVQKGAKERRTKRQGERKG